MYGNLFVYLQRIVHGGKEERRVEKSKKPGGERLRGRGIDDSRGREIEGSRNR